MGHHDHDHDHDHEEDSQSHGFGHGHGHDRPHGGEAAPDHRHGQGRGPDRGGPSGAGFGDLGVLGLRLVVGGLLAGHGAQKLFGWFGGYGLEGTGGWLESMGFKPGKQWAAMAGASEFGGGLLTALGLLHPIGPLATVGAMAVAAIDVHGGKPIWATEGGAELPAVNMAVALALATADPGAFSLDRALGIRLPKELVALAALAVAAGVVVAETREKPAPTAGEADGGTEAAA